MPQSREVKSTGQAIGETKTKHWRNPTTSVFKGETRIVHLVLLHLSAAQVVNSTLRIHLGLVVTSSRQVGSLGALENVEVVISGVTAGVALGSDGGAWRRVV